VAVAGNLALGAAGTVAAATLLPEVVAGICIGEFVGGAGPWASLGIQLTEEAKACLACNGKCNPSPSFSFNPTLSKDGFRVAEGAMGFMECKSLSLLPP